MIEDGGGEDVEESVDRDMIEGFLRTLRGVGGTVRASVIAEEIVESLDRS